jgi:TRAP-type C4-dicarboxylate transport system substrate-binding protein
MKDYIEKYNDIPELEWKPGHVKGIEKDQTYGVFKEVNWGNIGQKWNAFFDGLRSQKFDISQTQITVIGGHLHKPYVALDLPYLFDNHDHATRVLDGNVGKKMRSRFEKATGIKSLAFTYSGGFRVIGSDHDIKDVASLVGKNLQTTPITNSMFKSLKAKAFPRLSMDIQETNDACTDNGAVETTYLRFGGSHVLKTNHSMFLTSILVGSELFKKLTPKQTKAFEDAAFKVGKIERKWSLEDCKKYEDEAESKGIQIRDITAEEDSDMREHGKVAYDKFLHLQDGKFKADRTNLINEIRQA